MDHLAAEPLEVERTGFPADVIPLQYQALLLTDERRMDAFQRAIVHAVRPGMRVLDLGAGTGVLSFFAASQGATVTAVEREPRVFATARAALRAAVGDAVRVLHADARDYLPEEPVDVVLCEMLHVGLLRERQLEVINSFKRRYLRHVGGPLPRFLPEACVQAAQPVEQDFTYCGYTVPAPVFQLPDSIQPRTVEAAPPQVFQQFFYQDPLPGRCGADLRFVAERPATVNAARIVTKNLLALTYEPPGSIDWTMNYLVVPLREPVEVLAGDEVRLRFDYCPGDEIPALTDSLEVNVLAPAG
ncbi:methyltransferase domain-containing protein [Dactylosporangium roseum]|uniref:Methyltransferase domain-containing protein n=1 Tax=Dactylosporangium roseum TaxID=47989 RepID=A0ABY5Z0E0_9ACTN|nr:methyltransferase domain-containing protein [Dactylosporangium roseum]UWZ35468.1 methyltransferase domain-containing protein [Dactylosporangium roseum]